MGWGGWVGWGRVGYNGWPEVGGSGLECKGVGGSGLMWGEWPSVGETISGDFGHYLTIWITIEH